jgi:hypothetical protein
VRSARPRTVAISFHESRRLPKSGLRLAAIRRNDLSWPEATRHVSCPERGRHSIAGFRLRACRSPCAERRWGSTLCTGRFTEQKLRGCLPSFCRGQKDVGTAMTCRVCISENQSRFATEIAIHLPDLSTPHVFLFPRIVVCLDCGFTEFSIPETELPRLKKSGPTTA